MIFEKIICDRCKKEMNHPEGRKIWLSGVGREGGLDLCDGCYYDLYRWFSYPKDYVVCDTRHHIPLTRTDIGRQKELIKYRSIIKSARKILQENGYTMDYLDTIFGKVNEEVTESEGEK